MVIDRMACTVEFGSDEIVSFDVVPAFKRTGGGYEIPDTQAGWIATNPKQHHELTTKKNTACGEMWVPFVKMVKGANRELGEPVEPSFLLEVMALRPRPGAVRPLSKTSSSSSSPPPPTNSIAAGPTQRSSVRT